MSKPENLYVVEFPEGERGHSWVVVSDDGRILCQSIRKAHWFHFHLPVQWKRYADAEEWIKSGTMAEIQESFGNLAIGFCRDHFSDSRLAAPQAQEETSSVNEKENMTQEELFLKEVLAEIHRARGLFPTPDGLICAAGEEFGEVCKAYLDESKTRVREECVQLAAMAARITLEGDPTLEGYRAKRGADKET